MIPWLDTTYEPLLVQLFPASYTYEEIDAGFTRFEQYCLERRRTEPNLRIAVISDLSLLKKSNARNRSRLTQAYQTLGEPMEAATVCQALILPRAVLRHAATAVFWVRRPRWPIKAFAKQEDALAWIASLFEAEGTTMPMPAPWWLGQDRSDYEEPGEL